MSKGSPQLPRIQPVGRAALNPPPPHRDGDLAYIMPETTGHAVENWPQPVFFTPDLTACPFA